MLGGCIVGFRCRPSRDGAMPKSSTGLNGVSGVQSTRQGGQAEVVGEIALKYLPQFQL